MLGVVVDSCIFFLQEDIKSHPFFRTIDWQMLYDKQIDPPYNPNVVRRFLHDVFPRSGEETMGTG